MGKDKLPKRLNSRRPNPTGLLSDREIEFEFGRDGDQEGTDSDFTPVVTGIIEQLNDPSQEERACGCQHIARIVSQPEAVKTLLQHDIIKITAPLFLDTSVDVQKSALGAMRNMSVYGEEEVCELMVKNDVITPLSVVIKKFGENFDSGQKPDVSSAILLEAVELISNLCENNSRALQIFNKEGILRILLPLLNPDVCGYPLCNAVAHCMHVVSENNVEVSRVCKEPEVLSRWMNFITSSSSSIDGVLFKTQIIGIIFNLSDVDLSPYYAGFIQVIGDVLDMDCVPLIDLAVAGTNEGEEKKEVDLSQQDADKLVAAQRISLEMLANLCCSDDEWEEEMDDDGADDGCDDSVEGDGEGHGDEEFNIVESLCLPSEIQTALGKHDFLSKILKKAQPLEQSQIAMLKLLHCGGVMIKRFEDLQARALLCLSNLVGVVWDGGQPPSDQMTSMWTDLYSLAKSFQGNNEDFLWAVTSALRSVLLKMSEAAPDQILQVSQPDLEFLVRLGTESSNPETQINVIKMMSAIGCVLALRTEHYGLLKTVGEILLQVCRANEDIVVVSEALDSMFDVFKEDETDPVAVQISLVKQLKEIQTAFKAKVSSQRKKLGQSYGIVMMARSNLAAFIKYKVARRL